MIWCDRLRVARGQNENPGVPLSAEENVASLVRGLLKRGVRLRSQNGSLHYSVRKGQLSIEDASALRANKAGILTLLERFANCGDLIPVAYSQQAHWNLYKLSEYPSGCIVSSVIRIRGEVSVRAIHQSIVANVHRHGALRTRIVRHGGILAQQITTSGECEFITTDFRKASHYQQLKKIIDPYVFGPVDLSHTPLFKACLVTIAKDDSVLILAAEHIVTDAYSMEILLRDVLTAYGQVLNRQSISLPELQTQFAEYAVWQRSTEKLRLEKLMPYWNEYLSGCRRVKFPDDVISENGYHHGWGVTSFVIDKELRQKLHHWCRVRKTTMVMATFAAYVCVVFRWCETSDAVFSFQISGRTDSGIANTIGYFATPLYIRMRCNGGATLDDILSQAIVEHCRALEYRDLSYLEALDERPEFTRNSCFNWVHNPKDIDSMYRQEPTMGFSYTRIPMDLSGPYGVERDTEPVVVFMDGDEQVVGSVQFPRSRLSSERMGSFGRDLLAAIRTLISAPGQRMNAVALSR